MTAAALAAVAWGLSDFLAGLLARRLPVLTILIGSKVAAMLLAIVVVAVRGIPPPDDPRLLVAAAAGLVSLPSMGLLYRAMRDGSLAVVAPVAAVAALVPVGWGLLHGERLGAVAGLGVGVGLVGVTLASWPVAADRRPGRRSARLCALGAALGFGVYFVLLHEGGVADPFWSVVLARVTAGAAALLLAAGLARAASQNRVATRGGQDRDDQPVGHPDPRPPRGNDTPGRSDSGGCPQGTLRLALVAAVPIFLVGATDAVADAAFTVAAAAALAPAAVVSSLYPAVTLLLTRSLLRERLHTVHLYGVLAALFAVACLAR